MKKTFDDLVFEQHSIGSGTHAVTTINGKKFSVVFGNNFYSNGVDTYEAWCSDVHDEPRGYLTKDEVTEYMNEIESMDD